MVPLDQVGLLVLVEGEVPLDQVGLLVLAPLARLVLLLSPAAAPATEDLVDGDVADVEGGEEDEEGEGEREEDEKAGGDDLCEGTGTHLV